MGRRCAEKADYDYAHDLFAQCLVEDPANLIYLQHFLGNLAQKYGNSKKGVRFSGIEVKSSRMALNKAAGKGQWKEAFTAACEALKSNPWETSTLLDVADAYQQIGSDECQLFVMRGHSMRRRKISTVNRKAAETLTRLGQFDQAISCWRRVEQAKPGDEEAGKAISKLSVERTIQKGGYNEEILKGSTDSKELEEAMRERVAQSRPEAIAAAAAAKSKGESDQEKALLAAIEAKPADVEKYLELADVFTAQNRLREAVGYSWPGAGGFRRRRSARSRAIGRRAACVEPNIRWRSPNDGPSRKRPKKRTIWRGEWRRRPIRPSWKFMRREPLATRAIRCCSMNWGCAASGRANSKRRSRRFRRPAMRRGRRPRCSCILGESFQYIKQFKLALVQLRSGGPGGRYFAAGHEKTGTLPGRRFGFGVE